MVQLMIISLAQNFNPRSREGSDRLEVDDKIADVKFQSTLP